MRWIPSTWLLCAALCLGCEDDPDDLLHLRDAGTDAGAVDAGTDPTPSAPDAATSDDDAGR